MLLSTILILVLAGGFIYSQKHFKKMRATNTVKIVKDEDTGIWRVRDKDGNNKGTMKVHKNDKIYWQAQGSDVVFTFPVTIKKYFVYDEGLFRDSTALKDSVLQRVADKKQLKLTVRTDAPSDTLIYKIYVVSEDTVVVGHSPPKVIIQ